MKYLKDIPDILKAKNKQIFIRQKEEKINNLFHFTVKIILKIFFLILTIKFIFNKNNNNNKNTQVTSFTINKSISYDENGKELYLKNNIINFNLLDKLYYGVNTSNFSDYNNIHITLCVNEEYHILASLTIASILKSAYNNSYIHFHIIALNNLNFQVMKKIYSLKSNINNNTEFIFYNGKQVEEDFELGIKNSTRGAIDYGRLLISELINDIDKVISIDIGGIFVENDLFELYNQDLDYLGYLGVEDAYPRCFLESIFNHKERYVNGGVILLNVKKWKEMNLYKYIVKMFKYILTQTPLYDPYADIMNDFLPWCSTGYMPLKYNFQDNIEINQTKEENDGSITEKQCSYYFGKEIIVLEAKKNVVIRNIFMHKKYKDIEKINNLGKKYPKLYDFMLKYINNKEISSIKK